MLQVSSMESHILKAPVKMQMDCPQGIIYKVINIYYQVTESLGLKTWDSKQLSLDDVVYPSVSYCPREKQ